MLAALALSDKGAKIGGVWMLSGRICVCNTQFGASKVGKSHFVDTQTNYMRPQTQKHTQTNTPKPSSQQTPSLAPQKLASRISLMNTCAASAT